MKWRKLGRVYTANDEYGWAHSHAYIPTPFVLDDDRIRVYVAFQNKQQVGRIGFVDVDAENPLKILRISVKPALDIGEPGTFDDNGVTPMCLVNIRRNNLMYYTGWQLGVKVRYYLFTGLAIIDANGETFKRYSNVPVLDRSNEELFVRTGAYVMQDDDIYKMWYIAGSKWIDIRGKKVPTYNMRYLECKDGLSWDKKGVVCMELSGNDEFGFGRPYIIKENNKYKMWYSIRTVSKGYRLGYAESINGKEWIRKDNEVGIDVSESGWDSEMICFSSIVDVKGKRYMFYNGNNYGETGFGVAVLEKD